MSSSFACILLSVLSFAAVGGVKPFPVFSTPRAVTSGPHDHFLANYFAINAWSPDNRYLLTLETDLKDKMPDGAPATLGLVDLEDGNRFIPVTTTRCWNFQEAAMAHWLPWAKDTFVFNDLRDGKFSAVILNWKTKEERVLPGFPVSAVSEDGEWAVSINYARLFLTRPDYGYAGDGQDPRKGVVFPEDDGLWRVNLRTGEAKLIVSTAAVREMVPKVGPTGMSYLCHTVISKDFKRIYFLSRSVEESMEGVKKFKGVNWFTTAFTCNADGSNLRRCFPDGWGSSHFNWKPNLSEKDAATMVVTCKWLDKVYTHVEFTVGDEKHPRQVGGAAMDFDGHCIYSPDGEFVSGDGYWNNRTFLRTWKIVRLSDMQVRKIGDFFVPEPYRDIYCRCDLHPRWRPDGRQIGFNSVHEGSRQVYVMDVTGVETPAPRPRPRKALASRLADSSCETYGIVHFGLNTYTDREWGYGDESPRLFNPTAFDADRIVRAAKAGGLGGLIVVAKHHDGFCLWPTKTTAHNITASPFRGGKGDYVREMSDACRRAGIKFGVYVSPWDRNSASYGSPAYVDLFHAQIKELLGGGYGEVFEMWFDGANGGDGYYGGARERRNIPDGYYRFGEVFDFVRRLQPNVCIFNESDDADFRWPCNERGILDPNSRATVRNYDAKAYASYGNVGDIDGATFHPCEADFPLRRGWFYHAKERGRTKNAAYLMQRYLSTVGNGGTMNIGIAPNRDGILDEEDEKALSGFKALKDAFFANPAKGTNLCNVVVMTEDVSNGEFVDSWRLMASGLTLATGTSIGVKRIRILDEPVRADLVKLDWSHRLPVPKGHFVRMVRYYVDQKLLDLVRSATADGGETDTAKWMTLKKPVETPLPGEPSTKPAIPPAPFPDRMSAYVWRNWFVVPHARLAEVVGASESDLEAVAAEMGLPAKVDVSGAWRRKGYITILRRNWHLLDYPQLLKLVDMTRDELAFSLMEDDFLFHKLGNLKPKCGSLVWNGKAVANTRDDRLKIARILKEENAGDFSEEPRFEFISELSSVSPTASPVSAPSASPFDFRLIFSYFADYCDPLADPDVGSFPEGLLQKLAAQGVNAVWMHTVLRTLSKDPKYPEFGEGCENRIANLNKLVRRCDKYGIKVYLYLNEPRGMPDGFFRGHPEREAFRGCDDRNWPIYAMCTSCPEVRRWVRDSLKRIFTDVPGLGGIFTITMSENLTNCASRGNQKGCSRCSKRNTSEIVAEINSAMIEGMLDGNPEATALLYDWAWDRTDGGKEKVMSLLPKKNVRILAVSETRIPIRRGGVACKVGDYSISVVGPGEVARESWRLARANGLPTTAKVQANCSWELASFPYLPVADLVAEHAYNLVKEGVDGVLLSWSHGCCPAPNLSIFRDIRRDDPDKGAVLDRLAGDLYGVRAVPAVRRAWKAFADGYREFPFSVSVIYSGPMHMGPANPLYLKPTGYSATMVGIPYDSVKRWCAEYPADVWASQMEKVACGFVDGCELFRTAIPEMADDKRAFAEKELKLFRAATLHFRSSVDQVRFYQARERGDKAEMRRLAAKELATAKEILPLVRGDSRFGFESSNQYFYIPQDLREKIISCRAAMED